jgi:hypothetical protein
MKRYNFFYALAFALVVVGCGPPKSDRSESDRDQSQVAEPATEPSVRLERITDGEAALAEFDRVSRIYKHSGGPLTTEFTIFHRPEGSNQKTTTLMKCDGDLVVNDFLYEARQEHDTWEGWEGFTGFTTVIVPDIPGSRDPLDEVIYSFSLGGGGVRKITMKRKGAQDVYPQSVFSPEGMGQMKGPKDSSPDSVEIRPGESRVLLDYSIHFSSGADLPKEEWETIRYLLTVSALKR